MKKIKKSGYKKLTQEELEGIYAALNGNIVDLESINWNYNFILDVIESISNNNQSTIDTDCLFEKLFLMSNSELLDIIIKSDDYWGDKDGINYKIRGKKSPKEVIFELPKEIPPFEFDSNRMSNEEYLMISQSLGNDLFVFVNKNDSKEDITIFSANRDNFHKLFDEFTSNDESIIIQNLQKVKEEIFK